jgi:uncharacterized membrane protein SpoIIM required for sporulation
MKEITFLKQNSGKWNEYEALVEKDKTIAPTVLTDMFVEITNDLAYANANYKQTKTADYLNGLASRIHQIVYKNKRENSRRFVTFYTQELPTLFGHYHKQLFYSFLLTLIATLIGVLSQIYDDSFVRVVLGDDYVDATIERIKQGNPIGIYGEQNQFLMFVMITKNNISVSFLAFVLGLFTAFGTAFILLQNGIMLGCFFTLFYQNNVLDKALKVVWIHGTLEISAIIIAGCAGFILGNSFVFPGTHTRIYALKQGGKAGIKIIIGLLPVFICAGFLESFVTRYTEMPLSVSLLIISFSLCFILFYFIFWPLYILKKSK